MIQDGIDYGEGFCRATEPGPDVEFRNMRGEWVARDFPDNPLNINGMFYRQPIKPKDKSMIEKMIQVNNPHHCLVDAGQNAKLLIGAVKVTLAEAERLGEVAKKMREDMEIKAGDFFMFKGFQINKCEFPDTDYWTKYDLRNCTKITNPAHIQSLTEIYEGMK